MKNLVVLFLAIIILSSNTCKKIDCAGSVYSFEAKAKILNAADSVNIGDTIWLEIACPVSQINLTTGQTVEYSNAANLGTAVGIGELIPPNGREAASDFKYYLKIGDSIINPNINSIREYNFKEFSNKYQLLLGIIPRKAGFFNIAISNAANVYRKTDKCNKANYKIFFSETQQHLYFIKQIFGFDTDRPEIVYCFKVK